MSLIFGNECKCTSGLPGCITCVPGVWPRDGIVSKQPRPDSNESIRVPLLAEVSN
jgi:hypothetical protein